MAPSGPMDPWTILITAKRTAIALERRADDLLRARALKLTQLRLLVDIDERRASYPSQLASDLLMSRQGVHHQLVALEARGAVGVGPARTYVRKVFLTPEGRDVASRGLGDLAPLLDRLGQGSDLDTIGSVLADLESATRRPVPRWQF